MGAIVLLWTMKQLNLRCNIKKLALKEEVIIPVLFESTVEPGSVCGCLLNVSYVH